MVKTEAELRGMLEQVLSWDGAIVMEGSKTGVPLIYAKAAAAKTLLWALGENDDDQWHITCKPGPPVKVSRV